MTVAFGAALMTNEAPPTSAQPLLPQLSITQMPGLPAPTLPAPALPVTPIRFGEQLRQSLDVEPIPHPPPLAPRVTGEAMPDELRFDEQSMDDSFEDTKQLITFTQPIAVPLEYAPAARTVEEAASQESSQAVPPAAQQELSPAAPQVLSQAVPQALPQPAQQALSQPAPQSPPQSAQPIPSVLQPQQLAPRDNSLLSVLSAIPETSALGATTINPATLSLASNAANTANMANVANMAAPGDNHASVATAQLASLTNAGLAQALVDGMTQQPGVLAPLSESAPQPLHTPRSALQMALGDRLHLQITQRSEHAVIRLDPPSMGTIEIVIQRDAGGNLQVHLRASNAEVARQLYGIGDSLRQDLVNRQNVDVSVHVSDDSREQSASQQQGQRQSQAQREAAPGRALSEPSEDAAEERGA